MNRTIKNLTRLGACALAGSLAAACSSAAPPTTTTTPATPAAGVAGAENLHRPVCAEALPGEGRCLSHIVVDEQGKPKVFTTPTGYGPPDLVSAYDIPSGGAGTTVAVVDAYNNPDAETDLATYRAAYGLPPCTSASGCFQVVNQKGAASPLPANDTKGWALEEALDFEMVSAACPACKIILVEVERQTVEDLAEGVDAAVALGATAISNSYAFPDDAKYKKFEKDYDHPGVFITAGTGDDGYEGPSIVTNWPAEAEHVTAVGGTTLKKASNARGWTETVWKDGGSGCSSFVKKPTWQQDEGCTFRMVGDVSAVADPSTPVAIYDAYEGGGWTEVGGTSVSGPLVASIFAAAGATGETNEYSYANPTHFNDVTKGSNGTCTPPAADAYYCAAEVGYDGPTGNGTPIGSLIK